MILKSKTTENPKRTSVDVVAVIPARAGQQSIKYKNLQKLGGKTLLAWAIEIALAANTVDAVVVSTENKKIAAQAIRLGAIVAPRPQKYSLPSSGDAGWYIHVVKWMEEELGWTPEFLVNLRPTSPLRFARDIDAMVKHIKKSGADGIKSVIPTPLHPYKMWQMNGGEQGSANKLKPVFDNTFRRQHGPDQPRQKIQEKFPIFWQDGQIDITRRKFILRPDSLKNENIWGKNLHGYVLDPRTSTDLDEPDDFVRASKIYRQMLSERK